MTTASIVEAARAHGVRDQRLLDVIRVTPRRDFVPAEHVTRADLDVPVPIAHDQVTTQPSLVATMLAGLALQGSERVLEVGTGLGYQTALLARLAAFVWSVEWWDDLASAARANLAAAGVSNVEVTVGDGTPGLSHHAPFHAIVVAAASPTVPPPLVEQLAPGGRLVQPVGPGGRDDVTLFVKRDRALLARAVLTGARFVPLVGAHGTT